MKNLFIGFIIGLILGGGIAWAATRAVLQSGSGEELGTTTNPLYIQGV
jgi:hypothetical protein